MQFLHLLDTVQYYRGGEGLQRLVITIGQREIHSGQVRQDEEFVGLVDKICLVLGLPFLQFMFFD